MAVNNLHRTETIESLPDVLSGLTTREVSINGIESDTIEPVCENYPLGGQVRYTGTILYEEKPEFGKGREIEFKFEARAQSELLIIKSEVDASLGNVLNQVNAATESEFRIYRQLSPHRDALWDFIKGAQSVIEITLLDEYGQEVDLNELEDENQGIIEKYPIEDATFSYRYEDANILVRYTAGTLQIDADHPDATEYIIQLFERDVIGEPKPSNADN